jgi:hypothetical protein
MTCRKCVSCKWQHAENKASNYIAILKNPCLYFFRVPVMELPDKKGFCLANMRDHGVLAIVASPAVRGGEKISAFSLVILTCGSGKMAKFVPGYRY